MTEAEAPPPKRVSGAELFFDLVFVFAITQMSGLLHADHSVAGVGRALVVFVPVYWTWVGMSVHANTRDVENPLDRTGRPCWPWRPRSCSPAGCGGSTSSSPPRPSSTPWPPTPGGWTLSAAC